MRSRLAFRREPNSVERKQITLFLSLFLSNPVLQISSELFLAERIPMVTGGRNAN